MGKISVKTITIKELIDFQKGKLLPCYKTRYNWDSKKTETLVKDIYGASDKETYTLGQIVYNGDSLVDGLARIITISLILKQIGKPYLELERIWTPAELRLLRENLETVRKALALVDIRVFSEFLLNKCTVVLINAETVSDCFSFFESGNERGKELEPTDLLKAFHLCSMRDKGEDEKLSVITRWEEIGKDELVSLFSIWYPIIKWSKNSYFDSFNMHSIYSFQGIEESDDFPFSKRLLQSPFSLDSTFVNGKNFFERCFYYYDMKKSLEALIKDEIPALDRTIHFENPSEKLCYNLFESLSLLFVDRFGVDYARRALTVIFKFSFALLFEDSSISIDRINEYVLSSDSILNEIQFALKPYDVYSYDFSNKLSDMRNVTFKQGGAVKPIYFDHDFDRWLREGIYE